LILYHSYCLTIFVLAILFLSFTRCMEDYSTLLLRILSCLLLRSSLLARVINTDGHWMFCRASKCSLPTILCSCCPFSPLFSCCLRHYTFYRYFHYHSSLVDFTSFYWVCFQQLHQIWKKLLYIDHTDPP